MNSCEFLDEPLKGVWHNLVILSVTEVYGVCAVKERVSEIHGTELPVTNPTFISRWVGLANLLVECTS